MSGARESESRVKMGSVSDDTWQSLRRWLYIVSDC